MTIRSPIDILTRFTFAGAIALVISSCAAPDTQHHIVISTREQKLALLHVQVWFGRLARQQLYSAGQVGDRRKNRGQCPAGRSIQRSPPHRRNRRARFARSRSDRYTHSLAAWTRAAKRKRLCSGHLHSRHAGGTEYWSACKLRMHSNAFR